MCSRGVSPNHDVYVQDGLLYQAYWDAGVVVADVSDPTDPELVAQFGDAPEADTPQPDPFPVERYYAGEGNAHYVQPSPNGDLTFVGDEKFPSLLEEDPDTGKYGGIRIFDTSDWDDVEQVGFISPPDVNVGLRTSHNFDVTQNRLHTSWYNGGVRVYDITDETDPEELYFYDSEGYSFWTAVQERGFTLGGIYGARSDTHAGGIAFLHTDRGRNRSPSFEEARHQSAPNWIRSSTSREAGIRYIPARGCHSARNADETSGSMVRGWTAITQSRRGAHTTTFVSTAPLPEKRRAWDLNHTKMDSLASLVGRDFYLTS
ncbi:LVIVD repeat-containing protein [Halalkalicoccus salilacus]|uniref:LVIVD repeat-containing protein n=1 Tax=Halalkalicoccus sp. GCM10025704 TaxID=3252662 RepID=UPI0036168D54